MILLDTNVVSEAMKTRPTETVVAWLNAQDSERLFRTLKYTPAYPGKPFESLAAASQWVHRFVQWYNEEHRHSGIRYVTPGQRHRGEDVAILADRKRLYEAAKDVHPERWSGDTRDWTPVAEVWLNPPRDLKQDGTAEKKVA